MVDLSKISEDLRGRIEKIMAGDGADTKKLDSRNEYNDLAKLLSGEGKVTGDEKTFVEGMIADYEEAYMIRSDVKERVLQLIKNGNDRKADDGVEIADLKNYLNKTKGLTKEEKDWIKSVIKGREVKHAETNKASEPSDDELKEADKASENIGKINKKPNEENYSDKFPPKGFPPNFILPKVIPVPVPVPTPGVVDPDGVDEKDGFDDKDHVDDKDGVDNKGAVQQGGVGNINVGPGATVIINNGTPMNPDIGLTPPEKTTPDDVNETKPKSLSPEEIKEARDNGEVVADALLGHTSNTEQKTVQDIVNLEVNSGNVLEFLRGYEKGLTDDKKTGIVLPPVPRPRDHFFEQMRTENNFPEQQDLMRKVASDLQVYLEKKYGVESSVAKEVAVILLEETLGKEEAEKLDNIALEELGGKKKRKIPAGSALFPTLGGGLANAISNLTEE